MVCFGMDLAVWWNLIVAVERFGIKLVSNVTVLRHSIGMEQIVFFVLMEKFGMNHHKDVFAEKEPNGTDISVL